MLSLLISRRYLFSSESRSVVNLISGLSVVAVAMPVAAMIVLLSVFNGFEGLVHSMNSAFDADLIVKAKRGATFSCGAFDREAVVELEGVACASYILEQRILVEHGDRQTTVTLRGVDSLYKQVFPVEQMLSSGRWTLDDPVRKDEVVLGDALAWDLGIRTLHNSDLRLYALRRSQFSSLLPIENYTRRTTQVGGIFSLDLETERQTALTSLDFAARLLRYEGRASALVIKLDERAEPEYLKSIVEQSVGGDFDVLTRYEQRRSFYEILRYEKWGIFLISFLVLIIASFSIVGAVAMLIVDKRDDMVLLKALGGDRQLVRRIFLFDGLWIALLAFVLGCFVGGGACWLQHTFGWVRLPAGTFLLQSYPVVFRWNDLGLIFSAFAVVAWTMSEMTVRNMIKSKL